MSDLLIDVTDGVLTVRFSGKPTAAAIRGAAVVRSLRIRG